MAARFYAEFSGVAAVPFFLSDWRARSGHEKAYHVSRSAKDRMRERHLNLSDAYTTATTSPKYWRTATGV